VIIDVQRKRRERQHAPQREKYSKVVYDQESQKVQQKREVNKERSGEPSKC